jgi:hypothetical protein
MRSTFTLYRYENLIKTPMLYVEELPEKRTYKIVVEGDSIDEILERMYLPEKIKMDFRWDIVNIVRGYKMLTANMAYTKESNELCKKYFRDAMDKFCVVHGTFYKFEEDQI